MLFTSPFFDNARLSAITFTDRQSSTHQPLTILQPTTQSSAAVAARPPKTRESRHANYRERVRWQRGELFNQGRRIVDEDDSPPTCGDLKNTDENQSFCFTAPHMMATFEQLLAQKPSAHPFPDDEPRDYDDHDTTVVRGHRDVAVAAPIFRSPTTAADVSIAQPHVPRATSQSPSGQTTLSISAPSSVRLGLIPRRLDRSLTPSMHGSSLNSCASFESHDVADVPNGALQLAALATEERCHQLLVTTVSLLAFGYAFLQSLFDM